MGSAAVTLMKECTRDWPVAGSHVTSSVAAILHVLHHPINKTKLAQKRQIGNITSEKLQIICVK